MGKVPRFICLMSNCLQCFTTPGCLLGRAGANLLCLSVSFSAHGALLARMGRRLGSHNQKKPHNISCEKKQHPPRGLSWAERFPLIITVPGRTAIHLTVPQLFSSPGSSVSPLPSRRTFSVSASARPRAVCKVGNQQRWLRMETDGRRLKKSELVPKQKSSGLRDT